MPGTGVSGFKWSGCGCSGNVGSDFDDLLDIGSGLRKEFRGPRGFACPRNVDRAARPVARHVAGGRSVALHIVCIKATGVGKERNDRG